MNVYKAKTANILRNIILVVLFVIIVVVFSGYSNNIVPIVFLVIGFYLLYIIFAKKRILVIKINDIENTVELTYRKFLAIKKTEKHLLKNIKCTYQIEIGPRGSKRKELRLYDSENELIMRVIPNFEGWSNIDVQEIYNSLKVLREHH